MRAAVRSIYGSSDVLTIEEIEPPSIGDDEVLVEVRAASVNPADVFMLTGEPRIVRLAAGLRRPRARGVGADFAGVITEVGAKVSGFSVGDEVFGEGPQGSFAEYRRVNQKHIAIKPDGVTFENAAALPMAGGTALTILRAARIARGQRVLVIGASGGIGSFAVQLAVSNGADVTGVCSTANVDLVRSLGAKEVFDYTKENFVQAGEKWDVILDLIADRTLAELCSVLAPNGTLVLCSGSGSKWFGPLGRMAAGGLRSMLTKARIVSPAASPNNADLSTLAELAASGAISPVIDRVVPLGEIRQALDRVHSRRARGKVVISI